MSRELKRLVLLLTAAIALAALAAVTPASNAQNAEETSGSAMVRVAHLSPDTAGVDVWIDGQRKLQNVGYDTVSDYATLPAGQHELELRPAGAEASAKPLLAAKPTLEDGSAYTVAGVGLNAQLRGQIFDDDLSAPAAGDAKVRVINAAVGIAPIDVTLTGRSVFGRSIGFAAASPYANVSPGQKDVRVVGSERRNVVLSVPGVDVGAGIIYTFAVIGGADKPIQFVPVVDARGSAVMPAGAAATGGGGTARVRIHTPVHPG